MFYMAWWTFSFSLWYPFLHLPFLLDSRDVRFISQSSVSQFISPPFKAPGRRKSWVVRWSWKKCQIQKHEHFWCNDVSGRILALDLTSNLRDVRMLSSCGSAGALEEALSELLLTMRRALTLCQNQHEEERNLEVEHREKWSLADERRQTTQSWCFGHVFFGDVLKSRIDSEACLSASYPSVKSLCPPPDNFLMFHQYTHSLHVWGGGLVESALPNSHIKCAISLNFSVKSVLVIS